MSDPSMIVRELEAHLFGPVAKCQMTGAGVLAAAKQTIEALILERDALKAAATTAAKKAEALAQALNATGMSAAAIGVAVDIVRPLNAALLSKEAAQIEGAGK